jgi:hypothetical protein
MAETHHVSGYPEDVLPCDGSTVIFPSLDGGGEAPLLLFLGGLCENDKYYVRDGVTSPPVMCRRVHDREIKRARTVVAMPNDGRIVAEERSWDAPSPRAGT